MQEEVTQKTVTFCIRTTKITADLLRKVLAAYLRHHKQKFGKTSTQIVFSTPVEHRGLPVHSGFDA